MVENNLIIFYDDEYYINDEDEGEFLNFIWKTKEIINKELKQIG